MSKWRPENWPEILKKLNVSENVRDLILDGDFASGVEAGADAMLEAFRKDGEKVNEYSPSDTFRSLVLPVKNREVKGTIIFIPDDD
jgi:hypothetical protein